MTDDLLETKFFLDERVRRYNTIDYIETDPIQIPHRFVRKEDVEIAAFLTASITWGQRKAVINNASTLMNLMDNAPYDFVMESTDVERSRLLKFVHRTFNGADCSFFVLALKNIYLNHGGLEQVFKLGFERNVSVFGALLYFRSVFFELEHPLHVTKHVSDVKANSAAKRLNMLLRWLVRKDEQGVDFGIWNSIPMSALLIPLDVHVGDVARGLNILQRKQNDWKALEELMNILCTFDAVDPVKYDYALFGMGVFEDKKALLASF
ncbi:MAG: TIGR02757 family protein [Porphyromonadaceae bacterium CG2_30_38_12]|nr:MAG: TIGR02757 family protein [Porphyromonadaceae bacterium CG2_30_38_12]